MADATEVRLPKLGLQMSEAVIVEWLRAEGDQVTEGEDLVEIETGKATATVAAPATGTLASILVRPDEEVPVGTVLGLIQPGSG